MRVAIISDAHAAGPDDPSQRSLVTWLDQLEADRLVLLGDIFHHWWGFPGQVMAPYQDLCAALSAVHARGIPMTYVPGNHDFALGPFFQQQLQVEVRPAHVATYDGVRFLLAHGDEADSSTGYRFTRAVLRSRPFDGAMRLLGPQRAYRLLQRLAGSSRAHGGDPEPLVAAQQAWATPWLGDRADVVVMGHIHVPRVVTVPGGTIVHLGDWVDHRTWLRIDDGVPTLVQGLEGRPYAPEGATRSSVSSSSSS